MKKDRSTSYTVSAIVSVGFALSTVGATYVDARIPSHFKYGARVYPYGYWVALIAIPLFLCTLAGLNLARTRGWKCVAACLPLVVAVAGSAFMFPPEIPHQGIVIACGLYAISGLIATWLRNSNPDLDFLHDQSLPLQVRLEGLKSAITLWQGIALATCAGFLALLVPWPVAVMNANSHVAAAAADLFLLNTVAMMQIVAISAGFIIGPIREAVGTVIRLTASFRDIRE